MEVIVDGVEYKCDNIMVSSESVHINYPPDATRVPVKSLLIPRWESIEVRRQHVGC